MKIALIATDKKKELMVQLCAAYSTVLSKHVICATSATGKAIQDATPLKIERLMSGEDGGLQQLASKIAYNEVDMLIFFRDSSMEEGTFSQDEITVQRLCDHHCIFYATNASTAEILLKALERGELELSVKRNDSILF